MEEEEDERAGAIHVHDDDTIEDAVNNDFGLLNFDVLDPNIQDVFVNNAYIAVGVSEISILFGTEIPASANKFRPVFRAFMSHDTFLRLMPVWSKRAEFLLKAYEGKPLSLREIGEENPEKIRELYEEMTSIEE